MNLFKRPATLLGCFPRRLSPNVYKQCPLNLIRDIYRPLIAVDVFLKNLQLRRYRLYSTSSKDAAAKFNRRKDELKAYVDNKKEKLRDTEQRIKERGNVLLQDLKDTKTKVRERVEEIVVASIEPPDFIRLLKLGVSEGKHLHDPKPLVYRPNGGIALFGAADRARQL